MNNEIRNKNTKIRNQVRKKQIQSYFSAVRTQIAQNQKKKEVDEVLNQGIKQHIERNDIQSVYTLISKEKNSKERINALSQNNLSNIFKLLIHNLSTKQSVLLVKEIIQIHYTSLFLDKSQQLNNKQLVNNLYQKTFESINNLINPLNNDKQNIRSLLDGYLSCILQLIFNQNKENQQNYTFSQIYNHQFFKELLFRIDYLYQIPNYLSVICISQLNYNVSLDPICRNFVQNKPQILQLLFMQTENKKLALPSLLLINSFLNIFMTNTSVITTLLPFYLQKIQTVYENLQTPQPWSKIFIFYDMLENMVQIFQILSKQLLKDSLGQMMKKVGFWEFCQKLFRNQTQNIRKELYCVVKYAVSNMAINNSKLQQYISYNLISYVVQGIQSNYVEIISQNLDILKFILRYSYDNQGKQIQFLQWLQECGVNVSLQNLSYFKDIEIASRATQLNELLEQCNNQAKMIQE